MPLDQPRRTNRDMWDESVPIHVASDGYAVKEFLEGQTVLHDRDIQEMGDVQDQTLLHLQCHFGLDTLSWARLGATVTGLDYSEPAIDAARDLAAQAGIDDASFVLSELYDAPRVLAAQTFDIVYTGIGALCWLPDIRRWAEIVAGFLNPGGRFYLIEGHPRPLGHRRHAHGHRPRPLRALFRDGRAQSLGRRHGLRRLQRRHAEHRHLQLEPWPRRNRQRPDRCRTHARLVARTQNRLLEGDDANGLRPERRSVAS